MTANDIARVMLEDGEEDPKDFVMRTPTRYVIAVDYKPNGTRYFYAGKPGLRWSTDFSKAKLYNTPEEARKSVDANELVVIPVLLDSK